MKTLSPREKTLSIAVASVIFLLLNLVGVSFFLRKSAELHAAIATQQTNLDTMAILAGERELWAQRDEWLRAHQPKLEGSSGAGVALLEEIKSIAQQQQQQVVIQNPSIGSPGKEKFHQAVPVKFETKSPWGTLVRFLAAVQEPGRFIVIQDARIQVDPSDATQMRATLTFARWFAP